MLLSLIYHPAVELWPKIVKDLSVQIKSYEKVWVFFFSLCPSFYSDPRRKLPKETS